MDKIRYKEFAKLEYGDPAGFLRELAPLEQAIARSSLPDRVKRLRTNSLKPEREQIDAAIFCIGISEWLDRPARFCPKEDSDFDFVVAIDGEDGWLFYPVQLKEVVRSELNSNASVQSIINGLAKYGNAKDLSVAIKFNRLGHFDPSKIVVPDSVAVADLWVYGSISEDRSRWAIWGDFVRDGKHTKGIEFDYPKPATPSPHPSLP